MQRQIILSTLVLNGSFNFIFYWKGLVKTNSYFRGKYFYLFFQNDLPLIRDRCTHLDCSISYINFVGQCVTKKNGTIKKKKSPRVYCAKPFMNSLPFLPSNVSPSKCIFRPWKPFRIIVIFLLSKLFIWFLDILRDPEMLPVSHTSVEG